MSKLLLLVGISIEKFPSKSVSTDIFDPFASTVAPGNGLPLKSVTLPLIVGPAGKISNNGLRDSSLLKPSNFVFFCKII
ncbi:hypothetical protein D3C84_1044260 [compost metagenome]